MEEAARCKRAEKLALVDQWKEELRLIREGRDMEKEDNKCGGGLFIFLLDYFEKRVEGRDPADKDETDHLVMAVRAMGLPALPAEVRLRRGENPILGMRRLNYELGGDCGDSPGNQRLLRLISRWLGQISRIKRMLLALTPGNFSAK